MTATESQLADAVLMIRPVRFESNPLTAASNRFQGRSASSADEQQAAALREFDGLAAALRDAGIDAVVIDDTLEPHTPDAVFPNNWVSFHADGRTVIYPMEAENRRTERRLDIIEAVDSQFGFHVYEVIDLSQHERTGHFLEGTGRIMPDTRMSRACSCSPTGLKSSGVRWPRSSKPGTLVALRKISFTPASRHCSATWSALP